MVASVARLLLRSEAISCVIPFVGVGVVVGLTANDMQPIAEMSRFGPESVEEASFVRLSKLGALKLCLDFISLFLFVLRIAGKRK